MSNLSFEAIRKQMEVNTTAAAQQVTTATSAVVDKTVQVAKSVGSAIHGVLPVTNNKLDDRTEDLLRMIAASSIRLQNLENTMGTLGFTMPEVQMADVDAITKALMGVIKSPKVAPQEQSQPAVEPAPLNPNTVTTEVVQAPVAAPSAPVEQPAPTTPGNPMMNVLPISQPSNWHLGPEA